VTVAHQVEPLLHMGKHQRAVSVAQADFYLFPPSGWAVAAVVVA
jgi:hypothetical protein